MLEIWEEFGITKEEHDECMAEFEKWFNELDLPLPTEEEE